MAVHSIALIPGDGIGKEVVPAAQQILDFTAKTVGGFQLKYTTYPWSCEWYLKNGKMMPNDGLQQLRRHDAIFLGAVGFPGVPDHVSLWGLLLPIRRAFHQYVNLRPVKLLNGIESPLRGKGSKHIDFLVVRENNEGEYSNMGGRLYEGQPQEMAVQNAVFTRFGVERIIRYAFALARRKGKQHHVTSATKSNGINYTMPFWDEVFNEIASEYSDCTTDTCHIDALAARFITHPERFDVVVASNLFGDILTDLGAAIAGSIGIAPSANINPEREFPSMFEPVHGSAPDIAGLGVANPVGQVWSGAMMLEHLGYSQAAERLMVAVQQVLQNGVKTADIGGSASTAEVTEAICEAIAANGNA